MDNKETTPQTENQHQEAAVAPEALAAPFEAPGPGKEYSTSIAPAKAKFEPLRPTAMELTSFSVEVIHVIVFVMITAFIFLSMWKTASKKT